MRQLMCFTCNETFFKDVSELEAERPQFCSDECRETLSEWAKTYTGMTLTQYYLLKRRNGYDPFTGRNVR